MRYGILIASILTFTVAAHADFSYKVTRKTGGAMAAMANTGPQTSAYFFKGQRMKSDNGTTATILDFDAQTVTVINNASKSYTVRSFNDAAPGTNDMQAQIDVKETGQHKVINGFNASEVLMTLTVDAPQMGKVPVEVDIWVSPDVPGSGQVHDFYTKNAVKFPWNAIAGGGNPGMQKAMADMQRALTKLSGVPVEEIVRMKAPGGGAGMPQMPQLSGAQADQLAKARAQLEALANSGGPAAAMAKQQLARMPGGAPSAGGSSNYLMEVTMDSSDFSSSSIDDSVFAIPAGYTKGN